MFYLKSEKIQLKNKVLCILAAISLGLVVSEAKAEVTWKGYMFGDVYYVAQHHNPDIVNANGFMFRRLYSTLDFTLTDAVKGRLRLEMAEVGDYSTKSKMTPFVKDAYLQTKLGHQTLTFGICGTPSVSGIEALWRYRHLEKTPLDLFQMVSSRDFGISLKGGDSTYYHIMFGNGNSNSSESNTGKKIMGNFGFSPVKGLILEFYADYEWESKNGYNYNVLQGLVGYQGNWGRTGFLYANRHYKNGDIEKNFGVFSGFVIVKAAERIDVILRFDKLVNQPAGKTIAYIPFSTEALANFLIAAVSYQVIENVWITPNIKFAFYENPTNGVNPGSENDLYLNLTFWWKFN